MILVPTPCHDAFTAAPPQARQGALVTHAPTQAQAIAHQRANRVVTPKTQAAGPLTPARIVEKRGHEMSTFATDGEKTGLVARVVGARRYRFGHRVERARAARHPAIGMGSGALDRRKLTGVTTLRARPSGSSRERSAARRVAAGHSSTPRGGTWVSIVGQRRSLTTRPAARPAGA